MEKGTQLLMIIVRMLPAGVQTAVRRSELSNPTHVLVVGHSIVAPHLQMLSISKAPQTNKRKYLSIN